MHTKSCLAKKSMNIWQSRRHLRVVRAYWRQSSRCFRWKKADALNGNGLRKDNARADDEDLALRESEIEDAFLDDLF
eukprot:4204773-Pleurochrysis_carterae.AAC.1